MSHQLAALLQARPIVFIHLVAALAALVLGAVQLLGRPGTRSHRLMGWTWVLIMGIAALSSAAIRGYRLPNIAGFSPIHLLTLLTLVQLPMGVWFVRRGNVRAHRWVMRSMYAGGCVVAGLFTLVPGRFLGDLLWKHGLGLTG
jgi:uncharacterized membrane protein